MLAKNEVAKVYETILSIPGMNEEVKVNLKVSRKQLLLLSKLVEKGLPGKDKEDQTHNILEHVPKEELQELSTIAKLFIDKAGLSDLNEKLKSL